MIKEEYVSLEVAKLLKEKGFDQNCANYYFDGQIWHHHYNEVIPRNKETYAAPTQAIVMRWLREVHRINIDIVIRGTNSCIEYVYSIRPFDIIYPTRNYDSINNIHIGAKISYEDACNAGIEYCLENLI